MTKVLLTGGSGFIAAHILQLLLDNGHSVTTTVRSEAKAQAILAAHAPSVQQQRLQVAIVPDIAQPGAFDSVVAQAGARGVEAVLHTASPFHYRWTDARTELVDPAVNGTTGLLQAVRRAAPSVRRVVVTSSFAAMLDEAHLADPARVFDESSWNPNGLAEVDRSSSTAYRVSKTLAERAAWDFVAREKPAFDLVTVNPPLVYGPVAHSLASLDAINTSNERLVALLRGQWRREMPFTGAVPLWVDVRDVALAHVRALELPGAAGRRLFIVVGRTSNRDIARIVKDNFPELADRLPGPEAEGGEMPGDDETFRYNDATAQLLGIAWITPEKSIVDTVVSLKKHGI